MTRLVAIALVVIGSTLPACAQHGGGHGGGFSGHSGGFSGHSASAFHGAPSGMRPSAPNGFRSAPRYPGARYAAPSTGYRMGVYGNRYAGPNSTSANSYVRRAINPYRNTYRDGNNRSPYRRPYRSPFVYGNGYIWPSPYYLGYPYGYDGSYDDSFDYGDTSTPPYADDSGGYDQEAYAPGIYPPPQDEPQQYQLQQYQPQQDQLVPYPNNDSGYAPEPAPVYRPNYPPSATAQQPSAPPAAQPTVTLIFKDGRPPQQIHNYLLSATGITVWDQLPSVRPREIPIDQLDMDATEKINRQAGVDFYLPKSLK